MRRLIALLERRLPPSQREFIIGDLVEAAGRLGPFSARLFLAREAFALLWQHRHYRPPPAQSRGDSAMSHLLQDARYAIRTLVRTPAFTMVSLLTLALGIGATTAIFSVVNPILFRSLPYPRADRLGMIFERGADGGPINVGHATVEDVARRNDAMASVAAMSTWTATLAGDGEPERLAGQRVSWTYFSTLGVRPMLGRDFSAADDVRGQHFVVMLSHGLWRRRFGGDSAIVGRTITLSDIPYTVAGVMPPGFENVLSPAARLWAPLAYDASLPWACRTCRHLRLVGRLRDGLDERGAGARLNTLSASLVAEHPRDYPAAGFHYVPLQEYTTRNARGALTLVLGAVGLVLLIACANLMHLLLARAAQRSGEFAIRAALGAERGRMVKQVLTEALIIAAGGGILGIAMAKGLLAVLLAAAPRLLPRLEAIRLDGQVLLFSATTTIATALLSALLPALAASRPDLRGRLVSARTTAGRHRLRGALVVGEVAMAMMLLAGTGLLLRSFDRLLNVPPGFETSHTVTMEIEAGGAGLDSRPAVIGYYQRVLEAARALPGVEFAGVVSQLPLGGNFDSYGFHNAERPLANPELAPSGDRYAVSPGYLEAMGIRVLRGRGITAADGDSAPPVILINETLARSVFPGEDPIGKRVMVGRADSSAIRRTIVGIVSDVRHVSLDAPQSNQFYVPQRQWPYTDGAMTLVARVRNDPAALAAPLRRAVREVDANQPIVRIATMRQIIAQSVAQRRFALLLFGSFGLLALALAAAGIYGVLAGFVAEREQEMGIRAALGATRGRLLGLVLGRGAGLTGLGIALGAAGGVALSRTIAGLLYGTSATDPASYGVMAALLMSVALAACLVPAWRAARADPNAVLRQD